MEGHDVEMGPIDIVVIAWPAGAPMTGEAFPLLLDLVDRGIVRVLDAMLVKKEEDGSYFGLEAKTLMHRASGTSRSSKAPRPACSGTMTPRRLRRRSNRVARPP